MLTGHQIMFQIVSLFNINKTQEHTMDVNDLLNVDFYNNNLKTFNQTWAETLLDPDIDLDEILTKKKR